MDIEAPASGQLDRVLAGLRAVAEETRLRLVALCAESDLTVTELTGILGQSQPRLSRHLKVLCEAGALDRYREGNWVFFRLARLGPGAEVVRRLRDLIPPDDPLVVHDRRRLEAVRAERAAAAAAYFRANAARWNECRRLHVAEAEVEAALCAALGERPIGTLLDVGTGTGRMLELFAERIEHGIGVDLSRAMLAVARANLEAAGRRHCQVRHGDMYDLDLASESVDAVVVHQVLHYADRPAAALAEAARVLRPGGVMVIADFAPHALEYLREAHAHRRLGFTDDEVHGWFRAAGLIPRPPTRLVGEPLTVVVWAAEKPTDGSKEDHR